MSSREELHKMVDQLPEDMLELVKTVLNEALNHIDVAWEEALEEYAQRSYKADMELVWEEALEEEATRLLKHPERN
jgi:hypothetical protein